MIGRKTKESLTGLFSHIPIGYIIACLTSGAISKQEAVMATVEGDANSEFSAALTTSLEDVHKSLKDEQTECIRRIISLKEADLPVLPTGFGKSANCNQRRTTLCVRD